MGKMSGRRRRAAAPLMDSGDPSASSARPGAAAKKRGKRELCAEFSAAVRESGLKERVAAAWARGEALDHGAVALDPVPFHHCVIPNFIQSEDFLEGLQKELLSLNFQEKSNDLYKFKQSSDLKKREEPHIVALRKVLFEEFRVWLSEVTQVELEPTIDLSCAKYDYTDALLCHDDELEGRRIAFILYLVPPWDKGDGGTLDLFGTDGRLRSATPFLLLRHLVVPPAPAGSKLQDVKRAHQLRPVVFRVAALLATGARSRAASILSQGKQDACDATNACVAVWLFPGASSLSLYVNSTPFHASLGT